MAQEQEKHHTKGNDQQILLENVDTDFFGTSGEEDATIWDNMVQALKPDLTPHKKNKR